VIFTEQTEMHHTSEITPFIELRLWEDKDIPGLRRMSDAMKTNGALAGIQLAYSGINGPNFYTKEVPLAPSALPIRTFTNDPVQARAMDKPTSATCAAGSSMRRSAPRTPVST
jgi:dimethylamine/trimethylamine dehydrogenase